MLCNMLGVISFWWHPHLHLPSWLFIHLFVFVFPNCIIWYGNKKWTWTISSLSYPCKEMANSSLTRKLIRKLTLKMKIICTLVTTFNLEKLVANFIQTDTLPSFKFKFSLGFITSCYVIFSLSMVQAMDIFMRRNKTERKLWLETAHCTVCKTRLPSRVNVPLTYFHNKNKTNFFTKNEACLTFISIHMEWDPETILVEKGEEEEERKKKKKKEKKKKKTLFDTKILHIFDPRFM